MALTGRARDKVVASEILAGNVPAFLRHLSPVRLKGKTKEGRVVGITLCVTPDYLAIGSDRDFLRIPMGLPAAAAIAQRFHFLLPTPRIVDAIYHAARVHLQPKPMKPGEDMRSTQYLWRHNQMVARQRSGFNKPLDVLTAGQKKDLVLSNRLRAHAGRVAIYGWHRGEGAPIQPLSTVHGAQYADYSHGVRLVSATAFVDGEARPLSKLLQDDRFAGILTREGTIPGVTGLLSSLHDSFPIGQQVASRPADIAAN